MSIDTSETSQLWGLASGELQVRQPDGAELVMFRYQDYCGDLPEAEPNFVITVEEEQATFIIINRPR